MLASWELFAEKNVRTLFVAVHSNYALFFLSFSLSLYIYIYLFFIYITCECNEWSSTHYLYTRDP